MLISLFKVTCLVGLLFECRDIYLSELKYLLKIAYYETVEDF